MNYFSSDKFDGKTREEYRWPKLIHKIMDPRRGLTVRMFQCRCGERKWTEDQE
jgi:hypothetical protein